MSKMKIKFKKNALLVGLTLVFVVCIAFCGYYIGTTVEAEILRLNYSPPVLDLDSISIVKVEDEKSSIYNALAGTFAYLEGEDYDAKEIKRMMSSFDNWKDIIPNYVCSKEYNLHIVEDKEALQIALNEADNQLVIGVMKSGFLENEAQHCFIFMPTCSWNMDCNKAYVYDASSSSDHHIYVCRYKDILHNSLALYSMD